MEKTFIIVKPDAVANGLIGEILGRYEKLGLRITRLEMRHIDGDFADRHYAEHLERDFYPPLREFMTEGPLVAGVVEGSDAVSLVRQANGATDPASADKGTIRADYASSVRRNCVHGSDSPETAAEEIALWFPHE